VETPMIENSMLIESQSFDFKNAKDETRIHGKNKPCVYFYFFLLRILLLLLMHIILKHFNANKSD
jgi:hypothetical protein